MPPPMTVRLIEAAQAPVLARPYFDGEGVSPIVASLAHVPELLEVAMPFIGMLLGPSALDMRTKELVVLRTSALLECSYCVAAHQVAALDSGLSGDEVDALSASPGRPDAFAAERERRRARP